MQASEESNRIGQVVRLPCSRLKRIQSIFAKQKKEYRVLYLLGLPRSSMTGLLCARIKDYYLHANHVSCWACGTF
jgi:hypothetical protein